MTLNDLSELFANTANSHPIIQAHYTHSPDEVDIDKQTTDRYPFTYAQVTSVEVTPQETTFEFDLVVGDIVYEEMEQDITQIHSATLLIMNDFIASFSFGFNAASPAAGAHVLDFPVRIQPYRARFGNLIAGWQTSVMLRVPTAVNFCDALH